MADDERDGPPEPPWRRASRARDRRIIAIVTVVSLLLAAPVVWIGGTALTALGDGASTAPAGDADPPTAGGGDGVPPDTELDAPDLDGLDDRDAAYGRVLEVVDRSEVTMLGAQQAIGDAFGDAFEGTDPDDVDGDQLAAAIGEAAGTGQRELQELRTDLTGLADLGEARPLRQVYLAHLDAWVRYLVAIERDPSLLLRDGADTALVLDIDTTADEFSGMVREELPDDLDEQVRAYADAIVDRGFPERDLADGDTVSGSPPIGGPRRG